jgi:hypothetical protein
MDSVSSAGRIDAICDRDKARRDGEPMANVRIGNEDDTR